MIVLVLFTAFFLLVFPSDVRASEKPPLNDNTWVKAKPITWSYEVTEESNPGRVLANLMTDLSLDEMERISRSRWNTTLRLDILQGLHSEYFTVISGELQTASRRLDRDWLCPGHVICRLSIDVAIVSPVQLFHVYPVTVNVLDINDNSPVFNPRSIVIDVLESAPIGTFFVLSSAEDLDAGLFGVQRYQFVSDSMAFQLEYGPKEEGTLRESIISEGGEKEERVEIEEEGSVELRLVVQEKLDRETIPSYSGLVIAMDGGVPPKSVSMNVTIRVLDANDNRPIFEKLFYNVSVREDCPVHTKVIQINAFDIDDGLNAVIEYKLVRQTSSNPFSIDSKTGAISLVTSLDYEASQTHILTVSASDCSGLTGAMTSYVKVTVHVEDVNDNAPSIRVVSAMTSAISENSALGQFVAQISVEDADSLSANGGRIDCILSGEGGSISRPPHDVTDPSLSAKSEDDITAPEPGPFFVLVRLYATMYKIVTSASFDRESRDEYHVMVVCSDAGLPAPLTAGSDVIVVRITDEDDMTPAFIGTDDLSSVGKMSGASGVVYSARVEENVPIGTPVLSVKAIDGDLGENAVVSYSLERMVCVTDGRISNGCEINDTMRADQFVEISSETGVIRTVDKIDYENITRLEFVVIATDRAGHSASASVLLDVVDVNDEVPLFSHSSYSFSLAENLPIGTDVGHVTAHDRDSNSNNRFVFSIEDDVRATGPVIKTTLESFQVDAISGKITATRSLDREQYAVHRLRVVVRDVAPPYHCSTADVTIYVTDRNDNAPTIEYPTVSDLPIHVPSRMPPGFPVTRVRARDADVGENARLEFSIAKGNNERYFDIDPRTGAISLTNHYLSSSFTSLSSQSMAGNEGNKNLQLPSTTQTRGGLAGRGPSNENSHRLVVLVKDYGKPEKSSVVLVELLFNRSLSFPMAMGGALGGSIAGVDDYTGSDEVYTGSSSVVALLFQNHRHVIIALACLTATLVLVLIATLFCARRRQTAARRLAKSSMTSRRLINDIAASSTTSPRPQQPEVSFSRGPEVVTPLTYGNREPPTYMPSVTSSYYRRPVTCLTGSTTGTGSLQRHVTTSNDSRESGYLNNHSGSSTTGRVKKSVQFDDLTGRRRAVAVADSRSTYVTFQGPDRHIDANESIGEVEVKRLIEILRQDSNHDSLDCSSLCNPDQDLLNHDQSELLHLSSPENSGHDSNTSTSAETDFSSGFSSGNLANSSSRIVTDICGTSGTMAWIDSDTDRDTSNDRGKNTDKPSNIDYSSVPRQHKICIETV